MKLATLKDGSRDGQLVVVSRDLTQAHFATGMATRLQQVLDDWNFISPQLEDLYATLNGGKARHAFAFEPQRCMAPLPRAYQWLEAQAYPSHGQRLQPAQSGLAAPGLVQGSSDSLLGPHQDARFANADWGIDFSGGLAVIAGDIRLGATPDEALDGVRLVMLANAWQLRAAPPGLPGLSLGRPAAAFAPLAVTPEELGTRWLEGRVHGPLSVHWNGRRVAHCDTGAGMERHFGHWLAQAAQTRRLRAGTILSTGAASVAEAASQGCTCIAELRALEAEQPGKAPSPYMQWGDTVRMEMLAENGQSIFGALEQRVVSAEGAEADAEPRPSAGKSAKAPAAAAEDAELASGDNADGNANNEAETAETQADADGQGHEAQSTEAQSTEAQNHAAQNGSAQTDPPTNAAGKVKAAAKPRVKPNPDPKRAGKRPAAVSKG
jgi:fumarylacetoacetate (FAA) hydrolase